MQKLSDTWANIRSRTKWWSVFVMILTALTALAVMLIFGFVPLWFPKEWEWGKDEMSILERMKFAAYLVGGVFLIWQLQISNRRAKALETTAASGEKGNITERFKNAIEHLADEKDSMQIGGIYTLYHVAKEAKEYKETVLKILLAHLRKITSGEEKPAANRVVTTILDALFARRGEKPLFEAVDLSYVNLKESRLGEMSPFGCNLGTIYGAIELDLTGAYFKYALLSGADMSHSVCDGTIFDRTVCVGTRFEEVTFKGASFIDADLSEADMSCAICKRTNFNGAVCVETGFYSVRFNGASFIDADLSEADMLCAICERTNFNGAVCVGTWFKEVTFKGASFIGTDLRGADFSKSNITAEQLRRAKTLYKAKLPDAVREEIMRESPQLFDKPDEDK